jgi:translation initiation factor IF-2
MQKGVFFMKNTSESPEIQEQEQAKPARRTRSPKTENATAVSQEQENKSTPRRSTSTTRSHAQAEKGVPGGETSGKTSGAETSAPERPAAPRGEYAPRRSESQRPAGENAPRQGGAPRQSGAPRDNAQRQGSGAPRQGSGAPRDNAPRQGGGPRPATSAAPSRPGGAPVHSARPGGNSNGSSTTYPQRQSSGPRPGSPSSHGGGPRPAPRHGGSAPGARPGGQHGGPGNRGGGRPSTPQRTHERRIAAVKEKPTGPISIPPQIVVKDLAELLQSTPPEIIRGLIKHSIFANINEVVDYEKAALVAQDLGFEPSMSEVTIAPAVQRRREGLASDILLDAKYDSNLVTIPPVVTIMGHVDHGKTTLLDTIRKTKVAAGEAGGITQHIGAYQVEINNQKITFLDTPGHEAFTAMRARGAQVADIAIIVVAADDGVMPQTREAIEHAQAARMPIIIALNKIDKAEANPDHVKQQLAEIGVLIEEYGGDVVCVPVSARRGLGIDDLLEMILLVAEVQDIKANPNRPATGVIIEARLEKSSGATATVLIQQGTLKMGDNVVVGTMSGKIRAMINDRGKRVMKAPPSTPVSILGLPEVPQAGDRLEVVSDEKTAKQIAQKVAEQRKSDSMPLGQVSLDTLYMQMQEGKVKELNVVLKCDVQGSAEAIKNALSKIGEENLKVRLIREGIGNISETDVHLAAASGAIIIGFNVTADGAAQRMAVKEGVDIRYYNIIYKLTDDIQAALTGMLEPTYQEVTEGHAEVQQIFKAGKSTVIAGCRIIDGKLTRASQARVLRKQTKVYEGKVASLRRGKDDVREVLTGYECGVLLEDFSDFEVGDVIEAFTQERVKPGTGA